MVDIEDLEKLGVKIQTWIDYDNKSTKYFKLTYLKGINRYSVVCFDTPEGRENAVNEMKKFIDEGKKEGLCGKQ